LATVCGSPWRKAYVSSTTSDEQEEGDTVMSDCRRPRVQREVARLRVVGFRDKIKRRASGSPRTYAEFLASSLLLGELREEGWHESVRCRVPRTRGGRPIPWWTYAANA